jgi:uncharacterized protein
VDIRDKVSFLSNTDAYPEKPGQVEVIETHISWIFLTDRFVYKLKKPVRHPYLDFRTIDARHTDCLEEVRLNRRLAEGVYLGVIPLTRRDNRLALGMPGHPVDWLVHMRRLPMARMLDALIASGRLQAEEPGRVGEVLGRFYKGLHPVEMDAEEYRKRFADDIEENHRELTDQAFGLPAHRIEEVCEAQRRFLGEAARLLDERIASGRVIEGHGDLRPEHVCVLDPPVFIDCLEFKREFRVLDAADELAFLAMECERLGASWVGHEIFDAYKRITGDAPPPRMFHFYQSFRATLRAKLSIWHNLDDGVREPEKWVNRANCYLDLAAHHAEQAVYPGSP